MVVSLLEKYDMRSASLFGSYARNEADENSDIDLLLEGNPGFRPLNVFGVAEDLFRLSGKELMCSKYQNLMKASSVIRFSRKLYDYEGINWTLIAAVLFEELETFIKQIDSLLYGWLDEHGYSAESS